MVAAGVAGALDVRENLELEALAPLDDELNEVGKVGVLENMEWGRFDNLAEVEGGRRVVALGTVRKLLFCVTGAGP